MTTIGGITARRALHQLVAAVTRHAQQKDDTGEALGITLDGDKYPLVHMPVLPSLHRWRLGRLGGNKQSVQALPR